MAPVDLNVRADATHGKFAHVIVDRYLITGQVTGVDADFDKDEADGAGLGASVENNLPGIAKGKFKIDAKFSDVLNRQLQPLKNRQSPFFAAVAKRGLSAGSGIDMMPASLGKYSPKLSKKDEVTVAMEMGARGDYHEGVIMLSPKTLLTGPTGTGPIDDNTPYGGATSFGGCAYMWVFDIAGGTAPTFTAKVQCSTTSGGTYTDIATFAAASGTSAAPVNWVQQVYVPSTTTVDAFTQVSWASTGTPTGIQVVLGFARSYDPAG